MIRTWSITNVRLALPDGVEWGALHVEQGRIAWLGPVEELRTLESDRRGPVLDGGGHLLSSGLVTLHDDLLEAEIMPRAGAGLPPEVALDAHRASLRAQGITTAFHAVGLRQRSATGGPRPSGLAQAALDLLREQPESLTDPVLLRVDITDLANLRRAQAVVRELGAPVLVSFENHRPGQGQYRRIRPLWERLRQDEGLSRPAALYRVARLRTTSRDPDPAVLAAQAAAILGTPGTVGVVHDPQTVEQVDRAARWGVRVAEFPTTVEAARRARARGMLVSIGAPNLVRGGSHCGNAAGLDLLEAGLVDLVVSDYAPGSMWPAIGRLVELGLPWPRAIAMASEAPAQLAGLHDRGALRLGMRAHLTLVDTTSSRWPRPLWSVVGEPCPAPATMDDDQPQ